MIQDVTRQVKKARPQAARRCSTLDYTLVILLMNLGLTIGELCSLTVNDVSITTYGSSTIRVHRERAGASEEIPLNTITQAGLQEWMKVRPTHPGEDALLINDKHYGVTPHCIQRRFSMIGKRIGIKITPHILRHTRIKNLIEAGIHIQQVSDLVGISSFDAFKLYIDLAPIDLDNVVRKLKEQWRSNLLLHFGPSSAIG